MRRTSTFIVLLALLVAVLGAACSARAGEDLTDARDILTRTVASTSTLRTATFRAELQVQDPTNVGALPAGTNGSVVEGQADLTASEFSLQILDGTGAVQTDLIAADGAIFSRVGGTDRWGRQPVDPAMLANPVSWMIVGGQVAGGGRDVGLILAEAIQDPDIAVALAGVETCPAGRCYRITVEIPPEAVWPLMIRLLGLDGMPGMQTQPPEVGVLPAISLSVLTDTSTFRLVELSVGGSMRGIGVQVRITISNPDGPVSIQAPPPQLVDDVINAGPFGGAATPAPTEPRPVEGEPVPVPAAPTGP